MTEDYASFCLVVFQVMARLAQHTSETQGTLWAEENIRVFPAFSDYPTDEQPIYGDR